MRGECDSWCGASLVLLACSFALHAVGPQADAAGNTAYLAEHTWAYQLTGMLKHGAELAGWMLLATGMAVAVSTADAVRGTGAALARYSCRTQWSMRKSALRAALRCYPQLAIPSDTRWLHRSRPGAFRAVGLPIYR